MEIKVGNNVIMEISVIDLKCLENDLLDPEDWFRQALLGKINNCKKRLISEWHPKIMADPEVTSIPGDEEGLLNLIFSHPDYKTRVEKDKEEK